uniref:LSM domain-containing protein n=2 Tax=Populus trichocarpa TaxID=3694 RepID=A0A3N7FZC1_POPTR
MQMGYKGFLASVDSYMNLLESLLQFQILLMSFVLLMECDLQLGNTEEYIDGQFIGNLGEILIRRNNVLYLHGVPEDEEIEDAEQD